MRCFRKLLFFFLTLFYSVFGYTAITFDLKGISGEKKSNVESYIQALSLPKDAQDVDYLSQLKESTQSALTVFGYYQSTIVIEVIEKHSNDESQQLVSIDIVLGPQIKITLSDIKLLGEGKSFSHFKILLNKFSLNKGEILQHAHYESAKSSFKSVARRYGYFDAKFEKSRVDVSTINNSAQVYLWFNTGPRYRFGDFVFDEWLPAYKYVTRLRNFNVGSSFDTSQLATLNADLNQTGYFKSMTIFPDFNKKEGLIIPLNVIASMQPEDSFNAGFGYSTDEEFRGTFSWERPWFNEAGHSIEGAIVASIVQKKMSFTYKIPLKDPLYNYLSLQTGYQMEDQDDTDTTLFVAGINRHWRLSNQWRRTVFLRYEHEQGLQGQQNFSTSLIIPGISFSRTRTKGGINTTWGDKMMFSLELSNEWWFSSKDLIKIYGQSKIIRTYSGHQFIATAELGVIETDSIYNVPSSMRFFTGGDQSIRGFDYKNVAPKDNDDYLIGGKYLSVASVEYRFPILDNWKIALFSDVGTATDDFSEDLSSSVGTGIIWTSPVGPIRLYVAKPLSNKIDDFAIHFMIGPEL